MRINMSVSYEASECSDTTTDVVTSDIFDLLLECGDDKLNENLSMLHLTQLRSRLRAGLFQVEKLALEREKEQVKEHAQTRFEMCQACTLVRDPRKRKVADLRQLHLQVLTNKPADLLCTSGIFSRLEEVALEGWFEHVVAGSERCPKCRQVKSSIAEKILLSSEVVNNLRQEFCQPENSDCCMERACSKCLSFVINVLGASEVPAQCIVPINNHEVEFLKEEIKKNKEEIMKLTDNIQATTADFQTKNLTCLQNLFEEMKSFKTEVKSSKKAMMDEDDSVKMLLKLSSFNGEAWESPRLALKMWEQNLKLSCTPKEEWIRLVCEVMTGTAKDWHTGQSVDTKTWKEFTEMFLIQFDDDMKTVVNEYINCVLEHNTAKLDTAQETYVYVTLAGQPEISYVGADLMFLWMTDEHIERFLLACLRAVDDNLKILLGLFNSQFALRPINATLLSDQKLINLTTYAELFSMIKKRTASTNNQQILTYHLEMKAVANAVMSTSAYKCLDQVL